MQEMASKYNLSSNKLGKMMKGYEKPKKEKKSNGGGDSSKSGKTSILDFAASGGVAKSEGEGKEKLSGLDELHNLSVVDEQDYKPTGDSKDQQNILPPKQWKAKSTLRG